MRLNPNRDCEDIENDKKCYLQDVLNEYEMYLDYMNGIDEIQLYDIIRKYLAAPENVKSVLENLIFVVTDLPEDHLQVFFNGLLENQMIFCGLRSVNYFLFTYFRKK